MAILELKFLGELSIRQEGDNLAILKSQKGRALLCYLAMTGKQHSRSALAGLFWPDMQEIGALTNLRQVVRRLQILSPYLEVQHNTLALARHKSIWLDVKEFESAAAEQTNPARLQYALSLYQGDFLEGFKSDEFNLFHEWVLLQRERLKRVALNSVHALLAHLTAQQDFPQAVAYAHRLLSMEPWHEDTHQMLMRMMALAGERSAAIAQFERCKKILWDELGILPAPDTLLLYEKIKQGKLDRAQPDRNELTAHSLPARSHNLPPQATSLIGRTSERRQLMTYLRDPKTRLISIVGMGGMGKTHLALALAHEISAEKGAKDGVYFVPLAHVNDRHGMLLALANQLGLSLAANHEPEKSLLHFLQEKHFLIILDNFEHLSTEADFIEKILASAPAVKILITTRQRMKFKQEWVFDLFGLPYPEQVVGNWAISADAVRLFEQCARQIRADFSLDMHLESVIRICQLTQGMPLALELAASQLRTRSMAEVVGLMENDVGSLATDLHNIPERHRSMRAVIESAWRHLHDDEMMVLCAASVFRCGFTLEALQYVTEPLGVSLFLPEILSALMDQSLLVLISPQGKTTRYQMLELVRLCAFRHLMEIGQSETIQDRHLQYFSAFAGQAQQFYDVAREKESFLSLEVERSNLQAALHWAEGHGASEAFRSVNAVLSLSKA